MDSLVNKIMIKMEIVVIFIDFILERFFYRIGQVYVDQNYVIIFDI